MNLEYHLNSDLFRNVTNSNTLESKYNPHICTRYKNQTYSC